MSECTLPNTAPNPGHCLLPDGYTVSLAEPLKVDLQLPLLELLRRASTELPADVVRALMSQRDKEEIGSRAYNTLGTMLENVAVAASAQAPLCQDTGSVVFFVRHPFGFSQRALKAQIRAAVQEATKRSWLRPNCVAALSGKNSGNNMDPFHENHPVIHFEEWEQEGVEIAVMLKGGGSENVGAQYRLPDVAIGAGRDIEGVRRCVIDAVVKAQGQGCAPGILSVAIGGDRVTSFEHSKANLIRKIGSSNPDPTLDAMEKRLVEELNSLGIGPMGYGGRTTALAVFLEELYRHPASFYVSISYMCWSNRRLTLALPVAGPVEYR